MKQLYLFWLSALLLLGVAIPASAQCTVEWNIEGGLEHHDKLASQYSTPTIKALPGTSYTATGMSNYFHATEGYIITECSVTGSGTAPKIQTNSYNGRKYVRIVATQSAVKGQIVTITLKKLSDIVKDKSFTLDIENGASYLDNITLTGSGEKINLANGQQTIHYSSDLDAQIQIVEKTANKIFSVKKDGNPVSKRYDFDSYYNIDLSENCTISVRVFEESEPTVAKSKVTLNFADDMAKSALSMIWSMGYGTIYGSDKKPLEFEIEQDKDVKFTFDTKDYVVTVTNNGTAVGIDNTGESYTWTTKFPEDATISISATERVYPTTDLALAIENKDGVILRSGAIDGEVIDLSTIEHTTITSEGVEYELYEIPVSQKSPKIFFEEKEGWWLRSAQYYVASGEDQGWNEAGCASPETGTVYIRAHKINPVEKVIVYFDGDNTKFTMRAGRTEGSALAKTHDLQLEKGYNEFMFDKLFTSEIDIVPKMEGTSPVTSSLFVDGQPISLDVEKSAFVGLPTTDGTLIHFFCGITTPTKHSLSINIADKTTVVTYDKILTHPNTSTTLPMFEGTEVSISPRESCDLIIDGEKIEIPQTRATTNGTHTFTVTGAHNVEVVYNGTANVPVFNPKSGSTTDNLDSVLITFPEATSAERNADLADDEISLVGNNENYAAISISVEKVADAAVPTFKATFNPAPVAMADYKLTMSEGFFTIDGDLSSVQSEATFTLKKTITEVTYQFEPTGDIAVSEYNGPMVAVIFDESVTLGSVPSAEDMASKLTVKFGDDVLQYKEVLSWNDTDNGYYSVECGQNMFMITTGGTKYNNVTGEFSIDMKPGLLDIAGTPSPAIQHTWTVAVPKEYTFTLQPDGSSDVGSLKEFILTFPEAETAEVNEDFYAMPILEESGYESGRYNRTGTITKIENTDKPSFKITFDPAPAKNGQYKLTIGKGRFLLDGPNWSPQIEQTFDLDTTVGISEICADSWTDATIYSIDGRLLFRKADKAAVESLDKGLYIVNGRKMLKK